MSIYVCSDAMHSISSQMASMIAAQVGISEEGMQAISFEDICSIRMAIAETVLQLLESPHAVVELISLFAIVASLLPPPLSLSL